MISSLYKKLYSSLLISNWYYQILGYYCKFTTINTKWCLKPFFIFQMSIIIRFQTK